MNRQYYLIVLLALAAIAAIPQYAKDASPTSLGGVILPDSAPAALPRCQLSGPDGDRARDRGGTHDRP